MDPLVIYINWGVMLSQAIRGCGNLLPGTQGVKPSLLTPGENLFVCFSFQLRPSRRGRGFLRFVQVPWSCSWVW